MSKNKPIFTSKRLVALLLAVVLVVTTVMTASAAATSPGDGADSDVTLQVTGGTSFSVTVPTELPIVVNARNEVEVATDARVVNNSSAPIDVVSATVEADNGWELVDIDTDFTKVPVDSKQFGMTIDDFATISGGDYATVNYDASVAVQSHFHDRSPIGHVVFVVDWNDGTPKLGPNDITYNTENAAVQAYLNTPEYDSNDYTYSNLDTSTVTINTDKPAIGTLSVPDGAVKITFTSEADGKNFTDSLSGSTYKVGNLIPGVVYDYSIYDSSDNDLKSGKIYPTGKVRMINGGVSSFNIRDIGGWSADGGTIKYGKIIRGSRLTETSDLELFKNTLGIKSEIDLRLDSEGGVMDGSVLGNGVGYTAIPMNTYYKSAVNLSEDTSKIKSTIVQVFNDVKENKPIYIHCWYGADRTSTVVFILEALLGMSLSDIDRDYEISSFNNNISGKVRTNTSYSEMVSYFNSFNKGNMRDNVIAWAQKEGILLEDINTFRRNMIDGSPEQITENVRLPEEYQEVSYIENTSTAWIDTGIVSKYGIRTKVGASRSTSGNYQTIFGAYGNVRDAFGWVNNTSWWAAPNAANAGTATNLSNNVKYDIDCLRTSDGYLKYSELSSGTNTYTDFTNTVTYALFARNKGASQDYPFLGKVYYCEIYDGDTMVANMIPCYRKADNKYGMFDIVRNTFYSSSNNVDFIGD